MGRCSVGSIGVLRLVVEFLLLISVDSRNIVRLVVSMLRVMLVMIRLVFYLRWDIVSSSVSSMVVSILVNVFS